MLKQNRAYILLAAALIIGPTLLTAPANAQTKLHVVGQRERDWQRDRTHNYRQDRTPLDRGNWNRPSGDARKLANAALTPLCHRDGDRQDGKWTHQDEPTSRIVRLRNGDIRLPNGDIVLARRLIRLRDNYFRLPNGDILLPNEEIVPTRRLERVRDNYFRLPDGIILQINL
ncbi:hypothetical protein JYQ62_20020 [Nostoc sp. UHCC 0702]|nr:hypothetical protein JYQ62_20020 [Nostoc sp. UHCC 0702]